MALRSHAQTGASASAAASAAHAKSAGLLARKGNGHGRRRGGRRQQLKRVQRQAEVGVVCEEVVVEVIPPIPAQAASASVVVPRPPPPAPPAAAPQLPLQSRKRQASVACEGLHEHAAKHRGLRFHVEAKAHDGLAFEAHIVEVLVGKQCGSGGSVDMMTALDILKTIKTIRGSELVSTTTLPQLYDIMVGVSTRLEDLLHRLVHPRQKIVAFDDVEVGEASLHMATVFETVSSVPILPNGGGSCSKLSLSAAPHIRILLELVQDACTLIKAAC